MYGHLFHCIVLTLYPGAHFTDYIYYTRRRMNPRIWSKIPLDILDYIRLAADKFDENPKTLSAFSLVCRRWVRTCRARLFDSLTLRSVDCLHFLESILRSTKSQWLQPYVKNITLNNSPDADGHVYFSAWSSIHRRLHGVEILVINTGRNCFNILHRVQLHMFHSLT